MRLLAECDAITHAEVLVISFLIGLLAAMIEVISTDGNDNLLLPLLTYSFLRYNGDQPIETLYFNFLIMLLFLVAILLIYKITNITKLSVAYSLLVGYVVMVQGGAIWVFPPLMLLLTFGILPMMKSEEKHMIQTSAFRKSGIGAKMINHALLTGRSKGLKTAIAALIADGNNSYQIASKYGCEKFREYTLYCWDAKT